MADDMFNPGRINGAAVGPVSSKEDLMTKLDAVGATPEQMEEVMNAYADWEAKKAEPAKEPKPGKAKTMFDRAREAVKSLAS